MGTPVNLRLSCHCSTSQTLLRAIVETLDRGHITVPFAKLLFAVMTLGLLHVSANAQANEWVWMGGSNVPEQPGIYGTIGVPQSRNIPGGRLGSATWTDSSGNLWLFGGQGADSTGQVAALNDLWKFSPSSAPQNSQWAWMGGSSTVICEPSLLPCGVGRPGVYGTMGVSAPENIPGSRQGAATWTDANGNFWLFGGWGYDAIGQPGDMNDLWKFDPAANQWTWISGNSEQQFLQRSGGYSQPGVYGTIGTPSPGNLPGGRHYASAWIDSGGNLWLFGGWGEDAASMEAQLNDLWKFDPATGLWTWMSGSSAVFCGGDPGQCGQPGVYGSLGTPAAGNTPGGRSQAASWIDKSGNFWLFGGFGYDANDNSGSGLNDLWKFDPSTGLWAWMSGSAELPCGDDPLNGFKACSVQPGIYGTLGVPAPGNVPPGGEPAAAWTDQQGNFWLFGGASFDLTGQTRGTINDLWFFNPSTSQWAWMGGDTAASNCAIILVDVFVVATCDGSHGVFGDQYIADPGNYPAARLNAQAWVDKSGSFWLFGGGTGIVFDVNGPTNDLWKYQPSVSTLPPAAPPIFSLKPGTYAMEGPLTISNGMANSSIYYTTDGTTPTTSSTLYSGPLVLSSSETLQAFATAPGYPPSGVNSAAYSVPPVLAVPVFSVAPGTYASTQTVTISDSSLDVTIYYTTDGGVPTNGSTKYTGPIAVTSSETINAIAEENGYAIHAGLAVKGWWDSAVATASYTINLQPPTFTINGTNITVARGALSGNASTVTVTPGGGFTGNVTLTAALTSSPAGAIDLPTLSFGATSPVNIASTNAGSATLTISTTAATTAALRRPVRSGSRLLASSGAAVAFMLMLFGIPVQRRRWESLLGMAFLLIALAGGVIACSGGGSSGGSGGGGGGGRGNSGTTPGSYSITVTGTSGTVAQTATLTLTVN